MKKLLVIASALLSAGICAYAQDDDMYFTPSKTSKTNTATSLKIQNGSYGDEDCADYNGQDYSDSEVDAYNRRNSTVSGDTLYLGDGDKDSMEYFDDYSSGDYYYSSRLARFNEPVVNIYYGYGVPFRSYYGWYDSWYDPWYYSWYDPWWSYSSWWNYSFWGWNWYPRHYSWYGWGWANPRPHYAWHDLRPGAGGGWRSNPAMGGRMLAGQTHYAKRGSAGGGMIWGGGRNYRDAAGRTGSNSAYSASSRSNGNSRMIYNGQQRARISSQRSYSSSKNSTSTRSYSNSSSSSSPSMGTRSFGGGRSGGSGSSMGSRSFGGGGGGSSMGTRSFGGGGGGRR